MAEGILYKVDMRLRPSGRSGAGRHLLAGFRRYQAEEAWTWEHLALTRARVVAGPAALAGAVAAAIDEVLSRARTTPRRCSPTPPTCAAGWPRPMRRPPATRGRSSSAPAG